ncbi:MAG: CopM family metallochaperone [Vibrionaceae bacterium]
MKLKTTLILLAMIATPHAVLAKPAQEKTAHHNPASMSQVKVSKFSQAVVKDMKVMHEAMMEGLYHQDSDQAFARSMIAHHIGAIRMAEKELKFGKDPELRKLAQSIIDAQKTEVKFMEKWLKTAK